MSSRNNNFFVEFETVPRTYKNPFNQKPIERKLESLDDTITVSNCLVTIVMHKDGSFAVTPNLRNVDEEKLTARVVDVK